eukprot:TRINITY_DN2900_c0_g1_i7.p1 TRINITY_DN2900_c0_g1~~TRINITY_DN2900_c0_g1_i7.p1  ORF type:complete len:220 (+),score=39.74 TRINITY_DN2900_c0_g1_i7:279-938(+)
MELLEVSETARAREIDAELKKNKWRNEWLDETDKKDRPFRMWLRKGVQPGAAWCLLCGKKIVYKSNGKKSISSHGIETVHVERLNALKHASTLPAASPVLAPLSKMDYLVDAKIRTCAFLAEHCLPLSLAPELVGFCQKLAADTPSLELPSSGSDSRASKPPCIMWSRVWGKDVPKEVWEPNHFVVCLPESETDRNQQLKRKSGQSQIHAFFSKKPRSQ